MQFGRLLKKYISYLSLVFTKAKAGDKKGVAPLFRFLRSLVCGGAETGGGISLESKRQNTAAQREREWWQVKIRAEVGDGCRQGQGGVFVFLVPVVVVVALRVSVASRAHLVVGKLT